MSGMNCREFEGPLMDRARSRPMDAARRTALAAHLEICGRCRGAFERQLRLSAAMETLADGMTDVSAPPEVERAILAELSATRARVGYRWRYGAGALAASFMIAWWLTAPARKPLEAPVKAAPPMVVSHGAPIETAAAVAPPVKRAPKRRARPAAKPEAPFIAIPYTLPLDPYERASVVRMDLPVAALIAAGLPVGMMDPAAQARTDVLVGQDGRARAVRLIAVSKLN
jgi:hypothetical protein